MPLLADIATAQATLQNPLGPSRAYYFVHCKVPPSPFTIVDERRREPSRENLHFPRKARSHRKNRLIVKAVTTLEPKCLAGKEDAPKSCKEVLYNDDTDNESVDVESLGKGSVELDERERMRRMKISRANKGITPWNKGRKHSPETIQRIKERTRLAMQDPKIKMKLANLGHAQSKETRLKIAVGVRMGWKRRREKLMVQEAVYYEWQNLIADAARNGYAGQEELHWDSYQVLSEKLDVEWVETLELRKATNPRGNRRAPKSPEQRKKIAEAIAAKWADPEYRARVSSGMARFHGTTEKAPRKPRAKPSNGTQSRKQEFNKKANSTANNSSRNSIQQIKLRRSRGPLYKDPMASSKLQMIKNIRAQRAAEEIKKTEAIERARLLIAEAEKAAKALEIAASRSPIARASLLETRKLIAEAVQSIESISGGLITSDSNYSNPVQPNGLVSQIEIDVGATSQETYQTKMRNMNGTKNVGSTSEKEGDLHFTSSAFHNMLNGHKQLQVSSQTSNRFDPSPFSLENLVGQQSSLKQLDMLQLNGSISEKNQLVNGSHAHHTKEEGHSDPVRTTKKWVRGRLVEVTESC